MDILEAMNEVIGKLEEIADREELKKDESDRVYEIIRQARDFKIIMRETYYV